MLQRLAVLARIGNAGCMQRLKLAAKGLDARWVNDLVEVMGKERGQTELPPLGFAKAFLDLHNGVLGEDGE
eukprot:11989583-Alexandrium_andersonii.AAC.1